MEEQLVKLYRHVLSLDYFELIKAESSVNNVEADPSKLETSATFQKIPSNFESTQDYFEVWEPLFNVEAEANIVKTIQTEAVEVLECRIVVFERSDQFIRVDFQTDPGILHPHDLVVICCEKFDLKKPQFEYVPHVLGIIENSSNVTRCYVDFDDKTERGAKFIAGFKEKKQTGTHFWVGKLCGMTTIEREYKALKGIDKLHIKEVILNPQSAVQESHRYFDIPENLQAELNRKYNNSQLNAISQTLKEEGITLIQGPPGTGKTMTVIGTVSVLLQSFISKKAKKNFSMDIEDQSTQMINDRAKSPWEKDDYDDWRNHIFDDVLEDINNYLEFQTFVKAEQTDRVQVLKKRLQAELIPEKILVCGPSNASVDEIIKKVLEKGLLDQNGHSYLPAVVRIGENYDESVAHISLDQLCKQKMFEQQVTDDAEGKIRQSIISQAKIVFGTLSSCGSHILSQGKHIFDTVIVDEAAQAVEVSTLIPLYYGCKRLILIGDPKQLPATVFSKISQVHNYQVSLFERFQINKVPIHLLNTQYRMHPKISKFISETFYDGRLVDGDNLMALIGNPKIYNYYAFSQLVVFNVKGYEEFFRQSFRNEAEAQLIQKLLLDLLEKNPSQDLGAVGIVSPYSAQISMLQKTIKKQLGDRPIEIKTVDGFQGREKDVIIFSAVRSKKVGVDKMNPIKSIGFLKDPRRMNVSLSRSRQSLIVVCDIGKLKHDKRWRALIEYSFTLGSCYRTDCADSEWIKKFNQNPLYYQIQKFPEKRPQPQQQVLPQQE